MLSRVHVPCRARSSSANRSASSPKYKIVEALTALGTLGLRSKFARAFEIRVPYKISQQSNGIGAQLSRDLNELDNIKPSLTVFILSHKRLRPPEPSGQLTLREPGPLAHGLHQGLESLLPIRMFGFPHRSAAGVSRAPAKLILQSDYPKLGFIEKSPLGSV